ncbi:MAG: hypothetical protein GY849_02605 [Deltaproteobacteria bacterium]|nr:hypothetical protein [Deltaproteobacteria bacterium]
MKNKKFQYKLKHERYIERKINKMSSEQLLNYIVDTYIRYHNDLGKVKDFRKFIALDATIQLAKYYKVQVLDIKKRLRRCAEQKINGFKMTLNFN